MEKHVVTAPLITTLDSVCGHTIIDVLGVVRGAVLLEALGNISSRRIDPAELNRAHDTALDKLRAAGRIVGAHAVLNVRLTTSLVSAGYKNFATEVLAYGTAVRLAPSN